MAGVVECAMQKTRRCLLMGVATALALPALASSRRALAPMTDGPFYPPRAWRDRVPDWDADLTRVERNGRVLIARGEPLALRAVVADTQGRLIDNAEVEIWQCDVMQSYRHPGVAQTAGGFDEGFQGFGAARSGKDGTLALRTIKPVPYPGRTPHIHVKLLHPSFGEHTSQLFIAGDAGNARDFLWRAVPQADRAALEMQLLPALGDSGLRWIVQHTLVVPA
jgi:protocatechuate 3,4-dioxygenase, beta subunit